MQLPAEILSLLRNYQQSEPERFVRQLAELINRNCQAFSAQVTGLYRSIPDLFLRFLLIRAAGASGCQRLASFLEEVFSDQPQERFQQEIVKGLIVLDPLRAYLFLDKIRKKSERNEWLKYLTFWQQLSADPLVANFDLFYQRQEVDRETLSKATEYLQKNLPESYLAYLLFIFDSKNMVLIEALLQLLVIKPLKIATMVIFRFLSNYARKIEPALFYQAVDAFIACAASCSFLEKFPGKLEQLLKRLSLDYFQYFQLKLLRLNYLIPRLDIKKFYLSLRPEQKAEFLQYAPAALIEKLSAEIEADLQKIDQAEFVLRAAEVLLNAKKEDFLFSLFQQKKNVLHQKALVEAFFNKLNDELISFLQWAILPDLPGDVLLIFIERAFSTESGKLFSVIKRIWLETTEDEVRRLLIRRFNRLTGDFLNQFVELIFTQRETVAGLEGELLIALIPLFQKDQRLAPQTAESVLNHLLVMLEEARFDQLPAFLHFFDSIEIKSDEQRRLICDELHLIQNSLLKSEQHTGLVPLVYRLQQRICGRKI